VVALMVVNDSCFKAACRDLDAVEDSLFEARAKKRRLLDEVWAQFFYF